MRLPLTVGLLLALSLAMASAQETYECALVTYCLIIAEPQPSQQQQAQCDV
jgi:hypothetical protein